MFEATFGHCTFTTCTSTTGMTLLIIFNDHAIHRGTYHALVGSGSVVDFVFLLVEHRSKGSGGGKPGNLHVRAISYHRQSSKTIRSGMLGHNKNQAQPVKHGWCQSWIWANQIGWIHGEENIDISSCNKPTSNEWFQKLCSCRTYFISIWGTEFLQFEAKPIPSKKMWIKTTTKSCTLVSTWSPAEIASVCTNKRQCFSWSASVLLRLEFWATKTPMTYHCIDWFIKCLISWLTI